MRGLLWDRWVLLMRVECFVFLLFCLGLGLWWGLDGILWMVGVRWFVCVVVDCLI